MIPDEEVVTIKIFGSRSQFIFKSANFSYNFSREKLFTDVFARGEFIYECFPRRLLQFNESPLQFLSHCKNSKPSQLLSQPNFQYRSHFPLSRRNPSSRASRRFKCVSVAGSFASHVSKVNNAIRVRAKVTGRRRERWEKKARSFSPPPPPPPFSLSHGKYVEYLNKSKQPKWFSNLN